MIVDLIQERLAEGTERPYIGDYGPSHDLCPANCCLYPQTGRPGARPAVKIYILPQSPGAAVDIVIAG